MLSPIYVVFVLMFSSIHVMFTTWQALTSIEHLLQRLCHMYNVYVRHTYNVCEIFRWSTNVLWDVSPDIQTFCEMSIQTSTRFLRWFLKCLYRHLDDFWDINFGVQFFYDDYSCLHIFIIHTSWNVQYAIYNTQHIHTQYGVPKHPRMDH